MIWTDTCIDSIRSLNCIVVAATLMMMLLKMIMMMMLLHFILCFLPFLRRTLLSSLSTASPLSHSLSLTLKKRPTSKIKNMHLKYFVLKENYF